LATLLQKQKRRHWATNLVAKHQKGIVISAALRRQLMANRQTNLLYVGEISRYVIHEPGQAPKVATIDFEAMKGVRRALSADELAAYMRARKKATEYRAHR
jgi:hypothetical protein